MSPRPAAVAWTVIGAAWLAALILGLLGHDWPTLIFAVAGLAGTALAIVENRNKTARIHTLRTHIRILEAKHRREDQSHR